MSVSYTTQSTHQIWVEDKEGKLACSESRCEQLRTKDSRPDLGYAERYRKYLKKVTDYNDEVDENADVGGFEPMPQQTPVAKRAGACCIDASKSIDEQHAEIELKRAEGIVLTDVQTKPRGKFARVLCYHEAAVVYSTLL